MIYRTVEEQQPGGYWLEHHGPTPSYNLVYVHAIGLYHFFSGDESVLDCLESATDFHIRYTYPGTGGVGGNHRRACHTMIVSTSTGCRRSASSRKDGVTPASCCTSGWPNAGRIHCPTSPTTRPRSGPKIAGGEYGLSARIAPVITHFAQGPEASIPQDDDAYLIHDPDHAVLRRAHGWFTCISGVVTPAVESRWGQDLQSYLSIWHESCLNAGGGNAKDQPAFSTFTVGEDTYLPTAAMLRAGEDSDSVLLGYHGHDCRLAVVIEDAQHVHLTFTGPMTRGECGPDTVQDPPGEPLHTAAGDEFDTAQDKIELSADTAGGWVSHRGLRIHMPAGSRLTWPVSPFNPYAADGATTGRGRRRPRRCPRTAQPDHAGTDEAEAVS
ncbi:MAG: hypothetical protein R2856_23145 [Caldilineaceae bacterium]